MLKYFFIFHSLILSLPSFSQDKKQLIEEFRLTGNDSIFIRKNSMSPYQVNLSVRSSFRNVMDSLAFYGKKGEVLGPWFDGTYNCYIKVTGVDSLLKMSAAHILLCTNASSCDPKKVYSKGEADALAKHILINLNKGADFAKLAAKYSLDPGSADKGGEYKDFFEHEMVSEFEKGVLTHKVGEYFAVETMYGIHIMKSTAVPAKDRYAVRYIVLSVLP